jgi:hypothetical protein
MTEPSLTPMSALASVHALVHSFCFLALIWLGLAYWVHRDARRRTADRWLVATATLLSLVPVLGPLVYLLFRPPETLEDTHSRRVEIDVLESRLLRRAPHCPVCHADVEASFLICPVCTTQLKERCETCAAPLERAWQVCPFCTMPVSAKGPPAGFDLDSALTAEAIVHGNGGGRPARRPRRTRTP